MDNTPFQILVNDKTFEVTPTEANTIDIIAETENTFHVLKNNKSYKAEFESIDNKNKVIVFNINGTKYTTKINDKYDRLIDQMGMKVGTTQKIGDIKAPMPGLVLEVSVDVGTQIMKGDKVMILEAMKMENVIKSPGDGVIKAIHIKKGTAVEKGQLLIELS